MSVWVYACQYRIPGSAFGSMLPCVAESCNMLQCVATHFSMLRCNEVWSSVLQCVVCVYELQNRRVDCEFRGIALCCTVLTRMCCSVLQRVAVCCRELQCVAVCLCVCVTCKIDVLTVRLDALYFSSCLFPLPRYVTFPPPISNVKTCYMCI